MTLPGLTIRRCAPLAEERLLLGLWSLAFGERWPQRADWFRAVAGGERCAALIAETARQPVGFALTNLGPPGTDTGAILALGVIPAFRRRGIGAALHDSAVAALRGRGAQAISLASGAESYFWPGIPTDSPEAAPFFRSLGWAERERSFDLAADLTAYVTPAWVWERVSGLGCAFAAADPAGEPAVAAFVAAEYPDWSAYFARAFAEARGGDVLLARSPGGAVVAACLVESPSLRWANCFPAPVGAPGCLLVAGRARGQGIGLAIAARALEILRERGCRTAFLGWTWLVEWYGKLGCQVWQEYIMPAPQMEREP